MNKVYDFKQRVLEQQLFEKLKDAEVMNSNEMRRKYKNVDITRLRTRLINYQIETYGQEICVGKKHYTREENLRLASRDRQRRYARRRKND